MKQYRTASIWKARHAILYRTALVQGFTLPHPPDAAQLRRQARRHLLAALCGGYAFALLSFGLGWFLIWWRWHTSFPEQQLIVVESALPMVQLFIAGFGIQEVFAFGHMRAMATQDELVQLLPIRQALDQSDESVVPTAAVQPEPLADTDVPTGSSQWGPLVPPPVNATVSLLAMGCVLLLVGGLVLALLLVPLLLALPIPLPRTDILVAVGASLVLLAIGAAALARSVVMERGALVTVDDWQLRWRRRHWWGTTTHALAWHEVMTWAVVAQVITGPPEYVHGMRMYVLHAQRCAFAWREPAPTHPAELEAHRRFLSLVALRRHRPLRDPSAAIWKVTKDRALRRYQPPYDTWAVNAQGIRTRPVKLRIGLSPEMRKVRRRLLLMQVPVWLVLLVVLLVGAWWLKFG